MKIAFFRSDLEDGEILQSGVKSKEKESSEKRQRINSERSVTSSKRDVNRSNGLSDAAKTRSKSIDRLSSKIDDSDAADAKKRHRKKSKERKKRRSESSIVKRSDRYLNDDDLLGSPRQTSLSSRMRRRGELARYDVRNIILKKRESRNKKKGSLSLSRSKSRYFPDFCHFSYG